MRTKAAYFADVAGQTFSLHLLSYSISLCTLSIINPINHSSQSSSTSYSFFIFILHHRLLSSPPFHPLITAFRAVKLSSSRLSAPPRPPPTAPPVLPLILRFLRSDIIDRLVLGDSSNPLSWCGSATLVFGPSHYLLAPLRPPSPDSNFLLAPWTACVVWTKHDLSLEITTWTIRTHCYR